MRKAYAEFSDGKTFPGEAPPERWDTEQLIYGLCDGDMTKREYFLNNVSRRDAEKWMLLRRYSNYVDTEWGKVK